jgi:hypothetical protein
MNIHKLAKTVQDAFAKGIPGRWTLSPMDCATRPDEWDFGFKMSNGRTGMAIHCKLWQHPVDKISIWGEYPREAGSNYDMTVNYTLKYPVPKKEMKVTDKNFDKFVSFLCNQFYPAYEAVYGECMEIKERHEREANAAAEVAQDLARIIGGTCDDLRDKFYRYDDPWSISGSVDGSRVSFKFDVPIDMASDVARLLRSRLEPDKSEKTFGETSWCADDVKSKLEEHDIPTTDDNVDLVIGRCGKINESMVEQGWLFIDIVISDLESEKSFDMEGQKDGTVRESVVAVV